MRYQVCLFILWGALAPSLSAYVPECPYFNDKRSCLGAVDENYENTLDYVHDEYETDALQPMLEAALDVRKLESFACEKTCYN